MGLPGKTCMEVGGGHWDIYRVAFLSGIREEPLWAGRGIVRGLVWLERESEEVSEIATHVWLWLYAEWHVEAVEGFE